MLASLQDAQSALNREKAVLTRQNEEAENAIKALTAQVTQQRDINERLLGELEIDRRPNAELRNASSIHTHNDSQITFALTQRLDEKEGEIVQLESLLATCREEKAATRDCECGPHQSTHDCASQPYDATAEAQAPDRNISAHGSRQLLVQLDSTKQGDSLFINMAAAIAAFVVMGLSVALAIIRKQKCGLEQEKADWIILHDTLSERADSLGDELVLAQQRLDAANHEVDQLRSSGTQAEEALTEERANHHLEQKVWKELEKKLKEEKAAVDLRRSQAMSEASNERAANERLAYQKARLDRYLQEKCSEVDALR